MSKKMLFLMGLLMAMVWIAGCTCPGPRPVVAAPPVAEYVPPPPPPPPPPVVKPLPPVEEYPTKKLKQRVFY